MPGAWDLIVACKGGVVVAWRRGSLRAGLAGLLAAIDASRPRHHDDHRPEPPPADDAGAGGLGGLLGAYSTS